MKTVSVNMIVGALLLGGFAIFGSGLLAFIHSTTAERIAANERAALLKSLHEVISDDLYDNALEEDVLELNAPSLNEGSTKIYRARLKGEPVAAVMSVTAPDGYSGKIVMLVSVDVSGTLTGVRVTQHQETPGLGDKVDISRDDWILGFDGKSLVNPTIDKWKVKKDGGEFDSFTGATITPRATVKAIARSLQYFENNQSTLFE